jgi:transposase
MEAADLMGMVLMSKRELSRIDVLARLESGRLTPAAASELLQVSERQVYRLRRRFREDGPAGMADRRRGRPSNNRLPDDLRDQAVALVREHYRDFGPTLAAEKLAERHDLRVSRETLRTWMIQAGIWLPRRHQPLDGAGLCALGKRLRVL